MFTGTNDVSSIVIVNTKSDDPESPSSWVTSSIEIEHGFSCTLVHPAGHTIRTAGTLQLMANSGSFQNDGSILVRADSGSGGILQINPGAGSPGDPTFTNNGLLRVQDVGSTITWSNGSNEFFLDNGTFEIIDGTVTFSGGTVQNSIPLMSGTSPTLTVTGSTIFRDVTLNQDAAVTVNPGIQLNIESNLHNDGSLELRSATLDFDNDATLTTTPAVGLSRITVASTFSSSIIVSADTHDSSIDYLKGTIV